MELANLARPEFVILVLSLNGLGLVLKYYTSIANRMIPLVLFAIAFLIGTYTGYVGSSGGLFDAIVNGGLVNGGAATAIAVFGWDAIHGVFRKGTGGA